LASQLWACRNPGSIAIARSSCAAACSNRWANEYAMPTRIAAVIENGSSAAACCAAAIASS
jgi:hypothetical protein